ncbi:MAG: pre-peptidase C-terminal domain-containing protein [Candidatus Helarchaeota archaeon]
MLIKENKKILFSSLLLTLFTISFAIPISFGYGSSFSTAQTITAGTLIDTLSSSDTYAYYKVYCSSGKILRVVLTYSASFDLDLKIYNPSESVLDSSSSTGTVDTCSTTCSVAGYYYIRVYRYSGSGDANFTLSVTIMNMIPGFDLVVALFSIITLLGLIIITKLQKSTDNLINF